MPFRFCRLYLADMSQTPWEKETGVDAGPRFLNLSFWWLILASFFVASLGEGIAFLEGYGVWLGDWSYFLLFAAATLCCVGYLIFAKCCFQVKINWFFAFLFLVLCIGNTVALWTFPSVVETLQENGENVYTTIYHLDTVSRVRDTLGFALVCLYFYIVWAVAPKCLRSAKSCSAIFLGGVVFGVSLIVYSLIVEWGFYESCFTTGEASPSSHCLTSYVGNPNTFAANLLFGVIALGYLQTRRHSWINYFLMFVFSFEIFLIFSKTSMLLLILYWLIYGFYRFFATIKAHPVRTPITLVLVLCAIGVCLGLWGYFGTRFPDGFLGKSLASVLSLFEIHFGGTLLARVEIWNDIIARVDTPLKVVFGLGEGNAQWFLGSLDGAGPFFGFVHNGLVLQYVTGGFLRLGVYFFLTGYLIYAYVKAIAHHHRGAVSLLLGMLIFLGHGLVETTSFLEIDTKGAMGTLGLILPVLAATAKDSPTLSLPSQKAASKSSPCFLCYLILAPVLSLGAAIPSFAQAFGFPVGGLIACFVCLCLLMMIPLIVALAKHESLVHYLWVALYAGASYFLIFALSISLPLSQRSSDLTLLVVLSEMVFLAPAFFFPLALKWASPLVGFGAKVEILTSKISTWFETKNDAREERYFTRKRNDRSRNIPHY